MSDGLPEAPFLAARVAFSDVADALGITRPALYRLWPSQYDFWIDLSRYIAYEVNYSQPDHDMPWNAPPAGAPPSPLRLAPHEVDAVMSRRTNTTQDIAFADVRVVIRAASLGYPAVADLGEIRRQVEARRLDVFGADLARSLAVIGRATDERSLHLMAASLWCIADGLAVLHRVRPERCGGHSTVDFGHGANSWTLLSLATRALYFGLSAAADTPDELPPRPPPYEIPAPARSWTPLQLEALDTATRLFVESLADPVAVAEGPNVLGYVTIARVAALAGVSRRTVYNVWPARAAMLSDVLDDLLEDQRRLQRAVLDSGRDLGSITDTLAGPSGVPGPLDPSLAFLIELGDEAQRVRIADAYWHLATDLTEHLDEHLGSINRSPRAGLTTDDLGLLWLALIQGGRRLRHASPTIDVSFAAAAESLVRELTIDD